MLLIIKGCAEYSTHVQCTTHTYRRGYCRVEECHVECHSKGNDQQESQHNHLTEGVEDVHKHKDIDACQRKLSDKDDEIDPSQEDSYSSNLPLPLKGTETRIKENEGKDNGAHKQSDLNPVHPINDVSEPELEELKQFHHKSYDTTDDDDSSREVEVVCGRLGLICV